MSAYQRWIQCAVLATLGAGGATVAQAQTAPAGATSVTITVGGAGGGAGGTDANGAGGRGGAGAAFVLTMDVMPGQVIAVTSGAPGQGGQSWTGNDPAGRNGGAAGAGSGAGGAGGNAPKAVAADNGSASGGGGGGGGATVVTVDGVVVARAGGGGGGGGGSWDTAGTAGANGATSAAPDANCGTAAAGLAGAVGDGNRTPIGRGGGGGGGGGGGFGVAAAGGSAGMDNPSYTPATGGQAGASCIMTGLPNATVAAAPAGTAGTGGTSPGGAGTAGTSSVVFAVAPLPAVAPPMTPGDGTITVNPPTLPPSIPPGDVASYSMTCTPPPPTAIPNPVTFPYTMTGLTNGTPVSCNLVITLTDGRTTPPGTSTATPTAAPVLPPVSPVLTPGDGQIVINPPATLPPGINPADVTGYTAVCTPTPPTPIPNPVTLPYTMTGLTNGTPYSCTLQIILTGGATTPVGPAVTATPSAAAVAVPTMGQWGLLLMSLGVAGFAARRVRKGRAD